MKFVPDFENDLWKMINNVQLREISNEFQNKMKEDIRDIKQSGKIVVPADKSTNLYKKSMKIT